MTQVKKDVRYLNKDFGQFRANLIEFAKNYFPDTYNDFNESSPGMMFIEMASYVGDVLSYYTDNQLKESFLNTAASKPNVLALAANVGYKTKNTIPATVMLDVFQLLPAKTTVNGKEPDWSYALTLKENLIARDDASNVEFRTTSLVNFSTSSTTCTTNSRVGTSITILGVSVGVNLYNFNNGNKYAKVFPVPVCAIPIISRPDIITEKDFSWIGVGVTNPKSSIAF
jgi:hypothetical protein